MKWLVGDVAEALYLLDLLAHLNHFISELPDSSLFNHFHHVMSDFKP